MRNFNEVKFEEPGYPIVKAFVVPYRDGDKVVFTRKVMSNDIEIWRDVLNKLKEFISESMKVARKDLGEVEKLELISDLIALFFKIPLVRELLPTTSPSPLKVYLLCRLLGFQILKDGLSKPLKMVQLLYNEETVKYLNKLRPIEFFSDLDLSKNIEHCWFVFPADTRPSFNTSGLIPHLLLTSALTWGKAIVEGLSREEAAILRLSAMLHDMGKPFRYADHVSASLEVAEILLEGLSYLDKIKEFISKHHVGGETREAKILSEMDREAASIDRVTELSRRIIGEEILKLSTEEKLDSNKAYATGGEGWEFWRKMGKHVESLSEKFVKRLKEKMENYTKSITVEDEDIKTKAIEDTDIDIGLIDIGEIQSFVFGSEELRTVAAASLVIDTTVMLQIPLRIQHALLNKMGIWFPYEAILYSAGGVVELIFPKNLASVIEEVCKELKEELKVPIRFASTPLTSNYHEVVQNLAKRIHEKKFQMQEERRKIRIEKVKGVRKLCKLCYLNHPSGEITTFEGEKDVCERCSELYKLGSNLHFRAKYESEIRIGENRFRPKDVFEIDWEKAGKWIVELISGHNKEELEKGYRLRNLGVVKVDGNLMGPFMGTCVSPTDAYERSARIDLALKKAFEFSAEALFKGVKNYAGEKEAMKVFSSIKLGILYAGGDDGLFFMPSWCALPFAIVLQREFKANLGNARGLAVGVVASPARSSVWAMIFAASKLIERAKEKARASPDLNVLCFDVAEGELSDSSAEARFESLREQYLSSQPFETGEFEDLLKTVVGYSDYANAFGKCFILSRFSDLCDDKLEKKVEEDQERIKQIRRAINSSLLAARSYVEGYEFVPLVVFLYAKRQEARMERSNPYAYVLKLVPQKLGERSRLADADRLIKMIGGGVL